MKQGNPTRRFGLIALLSAMIGGTVAMPKGEDTASLSHRKNMVLTNGGAAPIPYKMMNQKQRRKLQRQTQRYK